MGRTSCSAFLVFFSHLYYTDSVNGELAQLARASALQAEGQRFDPVYLHHEIYGQVKKQDERALRSFLILSFDNVFFNNSE